MDSLTRYILHIHCRSGMVKQCLVHMTLYTLYLKYILFHWTRFFVKETVWCKWFASDESGKKNCQILQYFLNNEYVQCTVTDDGADLRFLIFLLLICLLFKHNYTSTESMCSYVYCTKLQVYKKEWCRIFLYLNAHPNNKLCTKSEVSITFRL